MIVFDLQCQSSGHRFEAWFSSSDGYEDQRRRKLLTCPICADTDISKAAMSPNVGAKGNRSTGRSAGGAAGRAVGGNVQPVMSSPAEGPKVDELKTMIGKIAALQAASLKDSTWVGKDFEKQARAMDAGEKDQASIHGQATPEQARSMIDDGIGVMPLLVPVIPPEQQN
jgi:hypothetical protein